MKDHRLTREERPKALLADFSEIRDLYLDRSDAERVLAASDDAITEMDETVVGLCTSSEVGQYVFASFLERVRRERLRKQVEEARGDLPTADITIGRVKEVRRKALDKIESWREEEGEYVPVVVPYRYLEINHSAPPNLHKHAEIMCGGVWWGRGGGAPPSKVTPFV